MGNKTCILPGGYISREGTVYRDCDLVSLSGREEELLAEKRGPAGAFQVTSILSSCVRRIGSISPVTEEVARSLLVADRQFLLLRLRQITFGEQVRATIFCPWPDCSKKTDIDFLISDIPVIESKDKGPVYKMELSEDAAITDDHGTVYREIAFRLPNGGDQEAVSPYIYENEANALNMLLGRCIKNIGPFMPPGEEMVKRLSPLARMEIEAHMEAVAPKIDLTMETRCPECGRGYTAPFDLQEFFFGELRISLDLLYREIHYLAYHYHWSEKEIMEMSRQKRHKYIDVLADEIERLNNAL